MISQVKGYSAAHLTQVAMCALRKQRTPCVQLGWLRSRVCMPRVVLMFRMLV